MKVMQLAAPGGFENLKLVELPAPAAPAAGEIQVRIHASSLNYHDLGVVLGRAGAADGRIPMADGAGVVTAVGEGVAEFAVGDAVVSCFFPQWQSGGKVPFDFKLVPGDGVDGFARERVNLPATAFTHAPRGYSHEEAATLTTAGLTAWRALVVDAWIQPGDTVLVLGTGGVSIFALQFAKAAGARVIATSSSGEKLERLRALGADETINYREVPAWGAKALELTGGRGVDTVVEIGGAGTLDQSMMAARVGGHVALIGVLAGFAGPVQTALLMAKNLRVQGLTVGSRADQLAMIAGVEANGIRPVLDRHFPLAALADAFRHQASGAHFGKIIVDI